MKQIRFSFLLALCLIVGISYAQQVIISPIPQSITWGEKAFDNTTSFYLTGADAADQDAVALLNAKLTIGTTGVEIVLGEKDDVVVAAYAAEIPQRSEAYFLKVEEGKVVIAGYDGAGTYYGVQSFLQILKSQEVMSVTIKDFPSVAERGIIEGFYGNPYSHEDRQSLFRFFGENKMNVYIYGPKDDPYHSFGNKWRDPYPPVQAARMKELIDVAHENKVNFVWAVHPGNNINWTDTDGDGIIDDFVAAKNKFQKMYDLGVRAFAVFFDDIGGIGTDPRNQAKMMNYLTEEFVNKKDDVASLILCPTQYNQAYAGGDYLDVLGNEMDQSVRIMWTGKSVVRMIDVETMNWINNKIKRKAYIWLNYPVTDYLIHRLLMGPTHGNSKLIASQLSGFTSNPMEYAEASKVSLYSIADYTWNMMKYDSDASWLRAMNYLMPENYEAFKVFCEHNIDLGVTVHGLRMPNESAEFKAVSDPFMAKLMEGKYEETDDSSLLAQFEKIVNSMNELNESTSSPALLREIKPWVDVLGLMGQRGLKLLEMKTALQSEDSVTFINLCLETDSLEEVQNKIRSRDFPGSIKSPYPKPGNEFVAPFLKKFKGYLIADYRNKFTYRTDIFPAILLETDSYFIKFNGKYLTNKRGSSYPTFEEVRDDMNPLRQEWKVGIDPETERYSIFNAEDDRYLNEKGDFTANVTTNPYEAVWHTYNISRFNGKCAIQNGGSAGKNFWSVSNNKVVKGSANELSYDDFIFEIVPVVNETIKYPVIEFGKNYFIKVAGKYLTNNNPKGSGGIPTFKSLVTNENDLTQKWVFTVDSQTDRIKLVSAADGRYVNEKGEFGTNQYYPTWNTYLLGELGGKFAIRNAGDAGTKFWKANTRVEYGDAPEAESYVFEIVSAETETSVKNTRQSNLSLSLSGETIRLVGADVQKMQLINLQGVVLNTVNNANEMNIGKFNQGIYILSVIAKDSSEESFKLVKQD